MNYIANVKIHKKDRSGNTYHTVDLLEENGKLINTKQAYGYGDAYLETLKSQLFIYSHFDAINVTILVYTHNGFRIGYQRLYKDIISDFDFDNYLFKFARTADYLYK